MATKNKNEIYIELTQQQRARLMVDDILKNRIRKPKAGKDVISISDFKKVFSKLHGETVTFIELKATDF